MGKILVVTGKAAAEIVNEQVLGLQNIEILTLPISIAAFINEEILKQSLNSIDLKEIDFILIPGLIKGTFDSLEKQMNIPIYKGPRYAADLQKAILMKEKLNRKKAADDLFVQLDLEEINNFIKQPFDLTDHFTIGKDNHKIYIGKDSFPVILAEIVDAPKRNLEDILTIAKRYLKDGANIIDIGAEVKKSQPDKIFEIIKHLKDDNIFKNVPISVDSLNEEEILAGIDAGAELVLSIDAGNFDILNNIKKEIALVTLPTNVKKGIMPKDPKKRVLDLQLIIKKAKELGFQKIIGDPLLESPIFPGLMNSLTGYSLFREVDQKTPLMFGIGNVSELIDSDSAGVNAIMASLGMELNINAYLTTEYSVKSRNVVKELAMALKLSFLARKRKTPPKDMPLNLLYAKSKSKNPPLLDVSEKEIIEVNEELDKYDPDQRGFFQIWVDHGCKKIYVAHFLNKSEINKIFSGISGKNIGKSIISMDLVSDKNHILYLGKELEKAEICLFLGKTYVQDMRFGELP